MEIPAGVLTRAREGDVEAFRALLEILEKPIYQTVYRLVGGRFPGEVEDITQDVVLKIFRSLGRFDPDRGVKFSTWIYTFVKNHCFDVLKKRRLNVVHLDASSQDEDGPRIELDGHEAPPPEVALSNELSQEIERAVQKLPHDQRLVFVLREYQGLDYREISEVVGCSEGTVKSRLYRAKESLRNGLKRYVLR